MSFLTQETSNYDGAPIELYEFKRQLATIGPSGINPSGSFETTTRFTSFETDVVVNSNNYTSEYIQRSSIIIATDSKRAPLTITLPLDVELFRQYVFSPISDVLAVEVLRYHSTDTPTPQVVSLWKGRVSDVSFDGQDRIKVRCESQATQLSRFSLRRTFSPLCPYDLYDADTCKISSALGSPHRLDVTATVFEPTKLWANALSGDTFTGGFVYIRRGVNEYDKHSIAVHSGNQVTLETPVENPETFMDCVFLAGCDRSLTTCINKFQNEENYGGFPYTPDDNPQDGVTSVF